ncbi:caspase-7 [Caerostris extrusa]|uniref:Caspase-7 n=1 Tax=Caerostris extrusa TaxID=172846 RepID=A0AAV4V7B3_CAEEX|nr:caspase-7 [Caerostris extrusa]
MDVCEWFGSESCDKTTTASAFFAGEKEALSIGPRTSRIRRWMPHGVNRDFFQFSFSGAGILKNRERSCHKLLEIKMDFEYFDEVDPGIHEQLNENFNVRAVSGDSIVAVNEFNVISQASDPHLQEAKIGECHIFNYQKFDFQKSREGSENDAERLKHDFTELNFNVHCHSDLLESETMEILKEVSEKDHSNIKYFICCFLTHVNIPIRKTQNFYYPGMPGSNFEKGIQIESTDCALTEETENYLDFLVVNSTYLGTYSIKCPYKGIFFFH